LRDHPDAAIAGAVECREFGLAFLRRGSRMRKFFAVLILLLCGSALDPARANQYRWCALYAGGDDGGGINCYFVTLQQCQWAVSGVGGFCVPSPFANGRPVAAPAQTQRKQKTS
jgi:Protein of unknown function (DUF3551)